MLRSLLRDRRADDSRGSVNALNLGHVSIVRVELRRRRNRGRSFGKGLGLILSRGP